MDSNLNEYLTRKKKIDVFLDEQGWSVKNKNLLEEVDTLQSDFQKKDYRYYKETSQNNEESRYADYILLDKNGYPCAVLEAKRTSKDPIVGKNQAREYAEHIKKKTGKDVFIFLSNGYEIWFWNYPVENPRIVKSFHSQDALERIKWINENRKSLSQIPINTMIVNRPYQLE